LVGKPPGFPGRPNKKKAPLDTSLLRHSARLERINKGFNPSSASQSVSRTAQGQSSCKAKDKGKKPVMVDDPLYEGHSVPGAPPAPHLSLVNVQVIAVVSARCRLVQCLRKLFFLPEKARILCFHSGKQGYCTATLVLCHLVRLLNMLAIMRLLISCCSCCWISNFELLWLNEPMTSCELMVMLMVMLPFLLLSGASLPISISDYDFLCHFKMCLASAYGPQASHVGMATMFSVASFCLLLGGGGLVSPPGYVASLLVCLDAYFIS
jgi:hypothetical protein